MDERRRKAAALRYALGSQGAPRLTAMGSGAVAERIIAIAREHGIPLREDPHLIEVLSSLDLYEEIPPELYKAVAEILVFVYRMTRRIPQ
jgi:flagellar biosynthesis protein